MGDDVVHDPKELGHGTGGEAAFDRLHKPHASAEQDGFHLLLYRSDLYQLIGVGPWLTLGLRVWVGAVFVSVVVASTEVSFGLSMRK